MKLEELRESKCQEFIYRQVHFESGKYEKPVLVSRQEVVDAVCRGALLASQNKSIDYDTDTHILNSVHNILNSYSEYELTEDITIRLSELTGFKQENWSDLLKA